MKSRYQTGFLAISFFVCAANFGLAADTAETQVKNQYEDAKTGTKKGVRKMKRKVRRATGNDNVAKDAKDSLHDATDSLENTEKKLENKAKE
jgi:polyhydroxyalkanoate synthesis regulator phasin